MLPRYNLFGPQGLVRGLLFSVFMSGAMQVAAQELPLRREYPGSGQFECPAPAVLTERSREQRAQAGQLASEADNAIILGDYARAEQLLTQASELDPASADIAYSRARALETLGRPEDAMGEYCRAIARGAESVGILDSQARLDALDEALRARISPEARTYFAQGLSDVDFGFYEGAVTSFTDALTEMPDWPEAVYNRAIVLEQLGLIQQSLADYRRYMALRPADVDPLLASVAQRIGLLEGLESVPTPSPGNTLAFGVLIPGMGQYYSGRTTSGVVVLGAVLGTVVTGMMVKKITIRCLNAVPAGSDCPPEQVVDQTTERPLLLPALGVAAAVSIGGAVEAWIRARRRRAEQAAPPQDTFGLAGPSISSNGDRVDFSFLSLRFR